VRSRMLAVLIVAGLGAALVAGCGGKKAADKGMMEGKTPEEMKASVKAGSTGSGAPPASATKAPK
jgi:hypothetical protein